MYQLHYLPSNATHHLMWCTEIGQKYQLLVVDLGFAAGELWFLPGDNDRPPGLLPNKPYAALRPCIYKSSSQTTARK